jgi:methionine-S-sulfoxide reductase
MKKIAFLTILIIVITIMLNNLFSNKKTQESSVDEFLEAKQEFQALQGKEGLQMATFAGGCFWCMEGPLESIEGVEAVVLGYTGGTVIDPNYKQISSGQTGHKEAALVFYDPAITQYRDLVDMYWKFIDPTDPDGQFADKGTQYKTAIFFHNAQQEDLAKEFIDKMKKSDKYDKPIVVEVLPAVEFYLAEDYHQNYYKKQSKDYKSYYKGSGRESYVESNK